MDNSNKSGSPEHRVGVYQRPRLAAVRSRMAWVIAAIVAVILAVVTLLILRAR